MGSDSHQKQSTRYTRLYPRIASSVKGSARSHLYARHHSGPEDQEVKQALRLIGQDAITAGARRITLGKPGMALTLNGIAQGYITDQVAALMRDNGIENVLVNMGEIRASGQHPGGRPWMAGLEDPENPGSFERQVPLRDMALATSGGYGTRLGAFNHLFDPRTGRSAERYGRVSVLARRATTADALSTGMSFLPMEKMASCLRHAGATRVMLTHPDGRMALFNDAGRRRVRWGRYDVITEDVWLLGSPLVEGGVA